MKLKTLNSPPRNFIDNFYFEKDFFDDSIENTSPLVYYAIHNPVEMTQQGFPFNKEVIKNETFLHFW
jgi:hypothetical protein